MGEGVAVHAVQTLQPNVVPGRRLGLGSHERVVDPSWARSRPISVPVRPSSVSPRMRATDSISAASNGPIQTPYADPEPLGDRPSKNDTLPSNRRCGATTRTSAEIRRSALIGHNPRSAGISRARRVRVDGQRVRVGDMSSTHPGRTAADAERRQQKRGSCVRCVGDTLERTRPRRAFKPFVGYIKDTSIKPGDMCRYGLRCR